MRALEKLACGNCGGEGYIDDDESFEVCGYCLGTGSEKYTHDSMQVGATVQQIGDMIEEVKWIFDEVTGADYEDRGYIAMDMLESFLESYDPERLAARAEERDGA